MLDKLPIELMQQILSYVAQEDLSNITRCCRKLSKVTTPVLYSRIDLIYSRGDRGEYKVDPRVMRILFRGNKQHYITYIRDLRVADTDEDCWEDHRQARTDGYGADKSFEAEDFQGVLEDTTQRLLRIAGGPIKVFKWLLPPQGCHTIYTPILQTLFEIHGAALCVLEVALYELCDGDVCDGPVIYRMAPGGLPSLRRLCVNQVTTTRGVVQLHYLLRACVVLEEFGFGLGSGVFGSELPHYDTLNDLEEDALSELDASQWSSNTLQELLENIVFENLGQFDLKWLRLSGFYNPTKNMALCLRTEKLRYLHLHGCWYLDNFFKSMQVDRMELHTLKLVGADFRDDNVMLVDLLAELQPGLRELVCRLQKPGEFGVRSYLRTLELPSKFVVQQGASLEKLVFVIWNQRGGNPDETTGFNFTVPPGLVKLKQICLTVNLSTVKIPNTIASNKDEYSKFHAPAAQDESLFHQLPNLRTIIFTSKRSSSNVTEYLTFLRKDSNRFFAGTDNDIDGSLQKTWNRVNIHILQGFMGEVATSYGRWYSTEIDGPPKLKWMIFDPGGVNLPRVGYRVKWNLNDLSFIEDKYIPQVIFVPDIEKVLKTEAEEIERVEF